MKKIISVVMFMVISITIFTACGESSTESTDASKSAVSTTANSTPANGSVDNQKSTAESAPAAPTGQTKEFTIKASNFQFDVKEIRVKKGDKVKITMVNEGGAHGIGIPALGISVKHDKPVEFVADKAGSFDFLCDVLCGQGHDNMGGKLIVE